jgi:hypothetical protein
MIQKLKFYRENTGRWYVDLPEWEGSKEDLEMVLGADDLMNLLAQGDDVIYAQIGDEKFPGSVQMVMFEMGSIDMGGAWYLVPSISGIDFNLRLWLCDVTKFVFGYFPENIWFYRSF